ncbi:MAG TPA: sugar ABC transporter permease [Propionicimonas sp.]|jgi:putative multiple sugar transport system permease protein|uniref:ABC transporter permease subunit n=1 Tax=Propionicimonas sp. TaxID=1955623 RepID=UPI002F3F8511
MKALRQFFGANVRQYALFLFLILVMAFFAWQTGGRTLHSENLQNIIIGWSYVLVMALGMLFVIVMGQIDLAPGSVAAVVGICLALSIKDWGFPWWAGILFGIAVGTVIGMWQGAWLAYIGVPGFITTLAGQMLFRGLDQRISNGQSVPVPKEIVKIGSGFLPDWGPHTGFNNPTLLLGLIAILAVIYREIRRRRKVIRGGGVVVPAWVMIARLITLVAALGILTIAFANGRPGTSFPIAGIIIVALVIFYFFVETRTTIGRGVYAVGGNKAAAALTGINIKKVYFIAMTNMSFLAAVAAIMFVGKSGSTGLSDGSGWELDVIAAVFVGGAAVSGGVGTVVGSVIGGLFMSILSNGMFVLGVGSDWSAMIRGLVLLVAVAFDLYSKSQGRPSITGAIMKGLRSRRRGTQEEEQVRPEVAKI